MKLFPFPFPFPFSPNNTPILSNNTPILSNNTPIPLKNTPIPPKNTPINDHNKPCELLLSDNPTIELIHGIAIALNKLIYEKNDNLTFYHNIFDEKILPISSINNLVKINRKKLLNHLKIFIYDITNILSLTTAEIVTAYIYFEQIIYNYGFNNISIKSVRPLLITCISIASRTLDDINLTVKDIANILINNNYTIDPIQLVNMENFILQNLEYKLNYSTSVYINYLNLLIYQIDKNAEIPDLGIQ